MKQVLLPVGFWAQLDNIHLEFRISARRSEPENSDLVLMQQFHTDKAVYADGGRYLYQADAIYTDVTGLKLGVRTADCLPILFYNIKSGFIGGIHAGWRGTKAEILPKTLLAVSKRSQSPFEDYHFYFGPAARSCCYERPFVQENFGQLEKLGIAPTQVEDSKICTIHNKSFPSHRRERGSRDTTLISIIERKK